MLYDIKLIKNIKTLENLSLSGSWNEMITLENGESIGELINLQRISFNRINLTNFPLEIVVNLPSLQFLQINDKCIIDKSNVLNIYNKNINEQILKKLDELGISYNFDEKPSYVVRLRTENGLKVKYRIDAFKKMESVFNSFSIQTGIDKNDVIFYINGNEVNPTDTIKSFGYDDIIINVSLKRKSSSSRKSSSPKTTKRKSSSPKTTKRKSSSPKTTKRKSSSPKTTRTS